MCRAREKEITFICGYNATKLAVCASGNLLLNQIETKNAQGLHITCVEVSKKPNGTTFLF